MKNSIPARTRYAPSPTGFFHVGGARTALYSYLLAKQTGGQFIVRIEDTDQKRYNPSAIEDLTDGLRYLGLDWDEGVEVGGDFGPYIQSERLEIYNQYIQQMVNEGQAYRCFCSPDRLRELTESQQKSNQQKGYDRACRNISAIESERRASNGEPFTIRIKVPQKGSLTMPDALRGEIKIENTTLQDAVLMKSNGIPTYHFAVVVDDHLMNITHVLRGDEWLGSYGIHLHLYKCFGWEPPIFVHLPVILNPTGKGKMSKRENRAPDGSIVPVFVHTFRKNGYLPEAMVNYLALIGWSYDDRTEIMTLRELINRFSLERINKSSASFNYVKLDNFNGQYIRKLSTTELAERMEIYLNDRGKSADYDKLLQITPLIQGRTTKLSELPEKISFFFDENLPAFDLNLLVPKKMSLTDVPGLLTRARDMLVAIDFSQFEIERALKQAALDERIKPGQFFQPIRVATCGTTVAPPLYGTLEVLGKNTVIHRIEFALDRLKRSGL